MADSKKRIALKPHIERIREWVDEGRTDEWIADALGTSASSVQSFGCRDDIYRRGRATDEPVSVFEGVLDHGEQDGWGMWFDPAVADDPIWKEHWAGRTTYPSRLARRGRGCNSFGGGRKRSTGRLAGWTKRRVRERAWTATAHARPRRDRGGACGVTGPRIGPGAGTGEVVRSREGLRLPGTAHRR